ncbi:MAG: paraquat-inducible protein A [Hahellaceae bacterium]|nr:paraquat-inducible protein A [Hahellaceae bacterium]
MATVQTQTATHQALDLYACHECDLLIRLPDQYDARKKLVCPRCHHTITSGHRNPIDSVIALSVTGIIVLLIAGSFPFLSFATQGQSRTITLFQASTELYLQGFDLLALLVFCFIVSLPFLYLFLLLAILVPIKFNWRRSQPIFMGRLISFLLPWSMSEVFLIGVLVALIKVVAMADIVLGVSFWAYVCFAPIFTYVVSVVDVHRLWHWIEHGR